MKMEIKRLSVSKDSDKNRMFFIGDNDKNNEFNFCSNAIKTSKYTYTTFLPLAVFN